MKRILLPLFIICSLSSIVNAGIRDVTIDPIVSGSGVTSTRNINTTSPITGGGDLSADRTLAINTSLLTGIPLSTGVTGVLANANGGFGTSTVTGSGSGVLNNTPTLITPILGTPTSGNLANCTFPTLNQNTSGTSANVTGIVALANGGTAGTSSATARVNLAVPKLINNNTTITVGSGKDYATVQEALASLDNSVISPSYYVTITIDNGTFANTTPIYVNGAFHGQVTIKGANTYSKTMSSVQSSSGSSGAWSIILNVNSVSNIAVNDYVIISAPSGGSNPTYIAGCFLVTNVDSPNTRLTVSSNHHAAAAPSGAISATIKVVKTILTFTASDGIEVWGGGIIGSFDNLVLVGDGTHIGLSIQDNGRLYIGASSVLGIVGFNYGVYCNYSAQINTSSMIVASGCTTFGFAIDSGGVVDCNTAITSGNQYGVFSQAGFFRATNCIATGNSQEGFRATQNGTIIASGSSATGNSVNGYNTVLGYIDSTSTTVSNNGTNDYLITPIPLASGGTNAITAAGARVSFGIDKRTTFSNADYQILNTDKVVAQIGTMSAPRVATLPLASTCNPGQEFIVKDSSGSVTSTNTITITRAGSDMIDGTTTEVIAAAYGQRVLYCDGVSKYSYDKGVLRASSNLSDVGSSTTSRTNLGIGSVENTALSTWAGTSNITTVGAIATGTWNAGAITTNAVNDSILSSYAANRITNGSFTTDLTGWTGANWAWNSANGGCARHTTGSTASLTQAGTVGVIGRMERVTITIANRTAGNIQLALGGVATRYCITNGTYTMYTLSINTGAFSITTTSTFDGDVYAVTATAQTLGNCIVDGGINLNNGQIILSGNGNLTYPQICSADLGTTGFGFRNDSAGTSNPAVGIYFDLSGVCNFYLKPTTVRLGSTTLLCWASGTDAMSNGTDLILTRNSANFLEMQLGTNNQTFGIDETWTDASNYSRLKISATGTGADFILDQLGSAISTRPFRFIQARTLASSPTDEYAATIRFVPTYSGAYTVTRHNYMDMNNVTNATGTITDACVIRFDAAAGTHKAIDSGSTKTTPATVDAWEKININGTIYFIPCYTSKTS